MTQPHDARAVLIEVINALGAFKNDLVIVGGWVPDLHYPGQGHVGSLDVDLAVRPQALGGDAYSTLLARLQEAGFSHTTNPTRFLRSIPESGSEIKVDLLSGQYVLSGKSQSIQLNELTINSVRGIDLALENCEEITIAGTMPGGGYNTVRAMVVCPEAYLLVKAFALAERRKAKDAYDIAFIMRHYQPSLSVLAKHMLRLITSGLGEEAYCTLTEKFASIDSLGPLDAATVATETSILSRAMKPRVMRPRPTRR
jgi:hypothetical protein